MRPFGPLTPDPDQWNWFPWGVLRSAGFPIRLIEPLHTPTLVAAADSLSRLDREVALAAKAFLDRSFTLTNRPQRRRLQRAINAQRPIDDALSTENLESDVHGWNAQLEARARAAQTFRAAYEQARLDSIQRLIAALEDDRIQRAVLWQNR